MIHIIFTKPFSDRLCHVCSICYADVMLCPLTFIQGFLSQEFATRLYTGVAPELDKGKKLYPIAVTQNKPRLVSMGRCDLSDLAVRPFSQLKRDIKPTPSPEKNIKID